MTERYVGYWQSAEFSIGFVDWSSGRMRNPFNANSVAAQAWDRGAECAMRRQH